MSIRAITIVWEYSKRAGTELLLLLAIADYAHDDLSGAYPSFATLAKKTRMSRRNAIRTVQKLVDAHELEITGRRGVSNIYNILLDFPARTSDARDTRVVTPTTPPTSDAHDTRVVTPVSPNPLINRNSFKPSINRERPSKNQKAILEDEDITHYVSPFTGK